MDNSEKNYDTLQSIITRMANNSSNCKTWAITISAGLLAFYFSSKSAITGNKYILLMIIIPFFLLDVYYLGLEKYFRKLHKLEIKNINNNKECKLIEISGPKGINEKSKLFLNAITSFSIWGFYLLIGIIMFFILSKN